MAARTLIHPRDEIMQTMERIYRFRMTTTSGGNLSIRDGDRIWITPARVDKGSLRRDDIVCVRADGRTEGAHPPSSEFPFHQAIYRSRPDIRGIVHAHPVALVAFSICGQVPNTRLFHQAWQVCEGPAFAPYALPGSERLGQNIAQQFASGAQCVVLENHGVVVGGENLQHAFQRFETLEFTAKTIVKASLLGPIRYLDDEALSIPRGLTPLPTFEPDEASSREKELRRQLCDFVKRGYQQRLLISTEGSFSARVDNDTFLITPSRCDRHHLTIDDLVLVHEGRGEQGKTASRSSRNHRAIYARHANVGAIVNAYPVNATAFSVTGAALDPRTIPESYIFLRDPSRVPYGTQFGDGRQMAERVALDHPVLIQENDGVLVVGTSVLDAFDRLEVVESTAEAIINSRPIGQVVPMSDDVIGELRRAFFGESS